MTLPTLLLGMCFGAALTGGAYCFIRSLSKPTAKPGSRKYRSAFLHD